jgi:hypothetical protein
VNSVLIAADYKYDRNRRRRGLCRQRCGGAGASRNDHGNPTTHQICGQGRQLIVPSFRPPMQNFDIPPLDIALLIEALADFQLSKPNSLREVCDKPLRNPITGNAGCCARAASGQAATLPSPAMNCRRLIIRLVGGQQNRLRHRKTERLGGLEVHGHLELGRKLHREIARLRAAQNAIDISGGATPIVYRVDSVGGVWPEGNV